MRPDRASRSGSADNAFFYAGACRGLCNHLNCESAPFEPTLKLHFPHMLPPLCADVSADVWWLLRKDDAWGSNMITVPVASGSLRPPTTKGVVSTAQELNSKHGITSKIFGGISTAATKLTDVLEGDKKKKLPPKG